LGKGAHFWEIFNMLEGYFKITENFNLPGWEILSVTFNRLFSNAEFNK